MDSMEKAENEISTQPSKQLSRFEAEMQRRKRLNSEVVLLLDTSGSMNEQADTPGERRIDALRGTVSALRARGMQFRQACFNSSITWSDVILEPNGGTNLSGALEACEQIHAKHIIVVSDGIPDSREAAITVAERLSKAGVKIDAFYVGPTSYSAGKGFMDDLAAVTGTAVNQVSFKELEQKIAGVLTDGNTQTDSTSTPIAL